MITHCPSCHTHFRVYADQLAARAGQVRCGKCGRVFNALERLIEDIAPARAPRLMPESETLRAATADAEPAPRAPVAGGGDVDAGVQEPATAKAAGVSAQAAKSGAEIPLTATLAQALASPAMVKTHAEAGTTSFGFGPVAATELGKPMRRWPWLLGALLLLLALLGQAAYYYRSTMIAFLPEIKPYAVTLCTRLGCELPLPRRIASMSIEASDLQADTTNPDVMVLLATLRNRDLLNQQYPLLELTLTDAQDQPIVRRVLAPQDYLGRGANAQAGFAANAETAIKVFIEDSQVKAAGYRLRLFYP